MHEQTGQGHINQSPKAKGKTEVKGKLSELNYQYIKTREY